MRAAVIPSILIPANPRISPISTERALRQIKTLLERIDPEGEAHEDRINHSIDDVDTMLAAIRHEDTEEGAPQ